MRKIFVLKLITFLAAFLLFQIELIISKRILPDFGGTYLVWGSCIVFFQAVLLLGYFASYVILKKMGIRKFLPYYLGLFLLPLLFFPGRSFPAINPANLSLPLVLNVFVNLTWTIGPVFFVLSTASVVLQAWLADSDLKEKSNPYTLYAVSNLGSFAGLITYPFFFEAVLDLNQQFLFWRVLYFALLALVAYSVFKVKVYTPEFKVTKIWNMGGVLRNDIVRWLLYSAAPVIMFLAVTNILTYEVAPIPLLWVVPLCIYLLTFVLNFKQRPWAPVWVSEKFHLTFGWGLLWFFIIIGGYFPFLIEAVVLLVILFNICMFCQYQLHKTRPSDLSHLPLFYLIIAVGGFLGGFLTTWIMPVVSVTIGEYLLGLSLIALALSFGIKPELMGWKNIFFIAYVAIALAIWPAIFRHYNIFGFIAIFYVFKVCYRYLFKNPRALFFSTLMIILITPVAYSIWAKTNDIYQHRNYYGLYRVYSDAGELILVNGTTIHGVQYRDKAKQGEPLAYYHKLTPIGEFLDSKEAVKIKNIAIIGLGSGGLAGYSQPGQEIDYFEIDPDVYYIAKDIFTFVKNAKGKVNFITGDARLTIKKTPEKRYDAIVIDAFSGDAIPVHLLTVEAIKEYRRHLTDKGVLLFHISNRYLNFVPVLLSNANNLSAYANWKKNDGNVKIDLFATSWFALTWDIGTFNHLTKDLGWAMYIHGKKNKLMRHWTDKYSNMMLIVDYMDSLYTIKNFRPFRW